jgi:S-formylglutathione hydrolase FrmB
MPRTIPVLRIVAAMAASAAIVASSVAVATAEPVAGAAKIEKVVKVGPQRDDLTISSPAMGGLVHVTVLLPRDQSSSRGSLYLLDGAGDKSSTVSDWIKKGGATAYFANKNVNVVLPAGKGAFYTDWQRRDPEIGKPKWETFLTSELPPLIDETYNSNGNNAVAGLSMGGQAAFALATRHPSLYTGVGSMSGCPPVSGPINESYVRATVAKDGGDATNMWGPWGSPGWAEHDPSGRLDALRGKRIYISAGSGVPGPLDQRTVPDPGFTKDQAIAAGGYLEMGAYRCSLEFAVLMRAAGISATEHFRTIGTHSWAYWAEDLKTMWPVLAPAL